MRTPRLVALLGCLCIALLAPRARAAEGEPAAPRPRTAPPTATTPAGAAGATSTASPPVKLDAATCGDACALLTRYPFDQLADHGACRLCKGLDDTFCELDFPFNDVPSCDAWDELRNCVYARFGYVFASPRWQARFAKEPWYRPDPGFTERKLTPVARANVEKLKQLKAARHGCE